MSNKLGNKPRRPKRNRGHGGPKFIQLFRYVLDSPAYTSLSPMARAVLVEMNHAFNGSNNGRIILSERKLAERLGCDRKTARRAQHELVERGFIEPRVKGAFSVKFRRATEWRLNDRRCDVTGAEQSQAFLKWQSVTAQPKSKTRGEILPPYRGKNYPTEEFPDEAEQGENLPHYEETNRGKNYPTSISTSTTATVCADASPDVATPPPADDWRRNSKLPAERLEDPFEIPDFCKRKVQH
jgi:hypothetical protein